MAEILVVDDEPELAELVKESLAIAKHQSTIALDGLAALTDLRRHPYDLIVLDINLPKIDGLSLLAKLRNEGNLTPVILLTARGGREDVTAGLRAGADDYVIKPFGVEELVLRVNAILRRSGKLSGPNSDEIVVGPLRINESRHLIYRGDEEISLSPTEFRLIQFLAERAGRVVTKETLLDAIWGINFETSTTVIDTYISYLRKKLHTETYQGIKTVRSLGFKLEP